LQNGSVGSDDCFLVFEDIITFQNTHNQGNMMIYLYYLESVKISGITKKAYN